MFTNRAFCSGVIFTILVLSSASCTNKEVAVYQVPKEAPKSEAPAMTESAPVAATPAPSAPIQWNTPASWKLGQAGQMRVGSFEVPGSGDGSIVILGAGAGNITDNVNRWRGQVGLPEITESAVNAQMKTVSSGIGKAKWIKIVDSKKPEKGILGAIIISGESVVFIKLAGPIKTLDTEQANFLALVGSLQPNKAK